MRDLCSSIPECIGFSNTKRRIYVHSPPSVPVPPDVEVKVIGKLKSHVMAGIPIGSQSGGTAVMGTLSWFAVDSAGNYYGLTDAHVVYGFSQVYYPSPLLYVQPQYLGLRLPLPPSPQLLGPVKFTTNPVQPTMNVDLAAFSLPQKPYPLVFGKIIPLFFSVPAEGEPVTKIGARTGATTGIVLDTSATISMYTVLNTVAEFTGPIFELHTEEGDSGAPVILQSALVSTIVGGNGQFAVGNDPIVLQQTLSSWGLRAYFLQNTLLYTIPGIIYTGIGVLGTALAAPLP